MALHPTILDILTTLVGGNLSFLWISSSTIFRVVSSMVLRTKVSSCKAAGLPMSAASLILCINGRALKKELFVSCHVLSTTFPKYIIFMIRKFCRCKIGHIFDDSQNGNIYIFLLKHRDSFPSIS